MAELPTIAFDTSAINAFERGGALGNHLMIALRCGFDIRLPAATADEVLSTPDGAHRESLLGICEKLVRFGRCLWPPHEIIRLLVSEHFTNPAQFDWTRVNVRARIYETAIIQRDFTEELCAEQRREQFKTQNGFDKMWKPLRPELDKVLAQYPSWRPTSFRDAVAIATVDRGVLWTFASVLYRHVTATVLTEAESRAFLDICPPFRAACYSLVMAWYDAALRIRLSGEERGSGRNDLLMAAYLPYCGRFVTDDGAQAKRLREIAVEADLDSEVISYEQFANGFCVLPNEPFVESGVILE